MEVRNKNEALRELIINYTTSKIEKWEIEETALLNKSGNMETNPEGFTPKEREEIVNSLHFVQAKIENYINIQFNALHEHDYLPQIEDLASQSSISRSGSRTGSQTSDVSSSSYVPKGEEDIDSDEEDIDSDEDYEGDGIEDFEQKLPYMTKVRQDRLARSYLQASAQ